MNSMFERLYCVYMYRIFDRFYASVIRMNALK